MLFARNEIYIALPCKFSIYVGIISIYRYVKEYISKLIDACLTSFSRHHKIYEGHSQYEYI